MITTNILIIIVFSILLTIVAGIAKSIMDIINFKYEESIFSKIPKTSYWYHWFNSPKVTWLNKYKDRNPEKGPAFFYSTTIFVWVTDAWHFFQFIMLSCIQMIIALLFTSLCDSIYFITVTQFIIILLGTFFSFKTLLSFTFEMFWVKIWRTKKEL